MKYSRLSIIILLALFLPPAQIKAQHDNSATKSDPIAEIPFCQKGNSIVITIRLNDNQQPLSFLLDTGADGMAIRKSLADSLGLSVARSQTAEIVGGKMQVDISSGNTVRLSDDLSLENQNIAIFENISNYDGIIGLNLIYRFVTQINFDEQKIVLYKHGNLPPTHKTRVALPIKRMGALLLVPAELSLTGGEMITGKFIMDTGAHYQLILFSRYVRKNRLLLSGFKPEGQAATISMGHSTPVFYGTAHTFKLGDDIILNNLQVALQASTGRDESADKEFPDGSVGILFFSRFNFIIDISQSMIYLDERETEE